MVSTRSSTLLFTAAAAIALQNGYADATACDADSYSKVAAAEQTLHADCASWAAHLASGGVWTCESTCHDAVVNLVDTLPDCTFGGPYGQNYKQVVEGMVATCSGATSSATSEPAAAEAMTASPSSTTAAPTATTVAPSSSESNNGTKSTATEAPAAATATDSPDTTNESSSTADASSSGSVSDIATASGASTQTATSIAALVLVVAGALMQ